NSASASMLEPAVSTFTFTRPNNLGTIPSEKSKLCIRLNGIYLFFFTKNPYSIRNSLSSKRYVKRSHLTNPEINEKTTTVQIMKVLMNQLSLPKNIKIINGKKDSFKLVKKLKTTETGCRRLYSDIIFSHPC